MYAVNKDILGVAIGDSGIVFGLKQVEGEFDSQATFSNTIHPHDSNFSQFDRHRRRLIRNAGYNISGKSTSKFRYKIYSVPILYILT